MNPVPAVSPTYRRAASVHIVSAVWSVTAYALLLNVAAANGGRPTASGAVAGNLVMTTVGRSGPVLCALGGLVLLVLAGLFWCGVAGSLPALAATALVLLVLPGVAGTFEAVLLIGALLFGTLPLLFDSGLDHVAGDGAGR